MFHLNLNTNNCSSFYGFAINYQFNRWHCFSFFWLRIAVAVFLLILNDLKPIFLIIIQILYAEKDRRISS
jgi:hypothetical protein